MASILATRFTHSEGKVSLVFSSDGEKIHSAGSDGEMRVWSGIDDDDCENYLVGDEVIALALAKNRIFVSVNGTNSVKALKLDGDSDGVITRFTCDASCIDCDPEGSFLVAGSADMTLKTVEVESFTEENFSGHTGPVLSVSLDPKKEYFASTSCDGSVRVWSCLTKKEVCKHEWLKKSNDITPSVSVAGLKFSRGGQLLAVPAGASVRLLDRDSWTQRSSLTSKKMADGEEFTCVSWNSNDSLIAAGTKKGNLCVWDVKTGAEKYFLVSERKHAVCAIDWNPTKDEFCFADIQGHWGMVGDDQKASKEESNDVNMEEEDLKGLFTDEDEDDENVFSISKIQQETGFAQGEDGHLVHKNEEFALMSRPSSSMKTDDIPVRRELVQSLPQPTRQKAFQPGASPLHFTSRYMVYNTVGIVKSYEDDSNDSSIDVEFHDVSTHHAFHLSNSDKYTVGSLTDKLLALGREEDDEDNPSRVWVNNFGNNMDTNKDWSLDLPSGESVKCIAAGDGWVAVATEYLLRVFSASGIQLEITSLSGPPVCMTGHANKLLLIVHSSASPFPGHQSFLYQNITISLSLGISRIPAPNPLPTSRGSELTWAGFTELGQASTVDAAGMVRVLRDFTWYPICSLGPHCKGKNNFFYVIGIDERDGDVRGIHCKGSHYPPTVPKPVPSALPIELPVCQDGERTNLERIFMKKRVLFFGSSVEEKIREETLETMMKLFALACRSDNVSRAIEVCRMMPDEDSVNLAIQYASKVKKVNLASKLGEIALQMKAEEPTPDADNDAGIDDEYRDLFEDSQDHFNNPFLNAKSRQEVPLAFPPSGSSISSEVRNPFAKKHANSNSTSNSPSARGFDRSLNSSMSPAPVNNKIKLVKKAPIVTATKEQKENQSEKSSGGALKGFSLFLAEFSGTQPSDEEATRNEALAKWKAMERAEKDGYKSPRMPNSKKRKLSDSEDQREKSEPAKKPATASSFASKLSGFSFTER